MEALIIIILTLVSTWSLSKLAKYFQKEIDMRNKQNKKRDDYHEY